MYITYWNLREQPFPVDAGEKQVYMTEQYQEGLAKLYYLIDQRRLAGVFTGANGIGKTMTLKLLSRRALKAGRRVHWLDAFPDGNLAATHQVMRFLGIPDPDHAATLSEAIQTLQTHCRQAGANLATSLLLIDNAQHLETAEDAYLVHALCNLRNCDGHPIFTLILAGTDVLRISLLQYESVGARIQFDWQILPLTQGQTLEYVQYHIRAAGGDIWFFTERALKLVYAFTQGIPLSINTLCDTALMLGAAAKALSITEEIIIQAARETGLDPAAQEDTPDLDAAQTA